MEKRRISASMCKFIYGESQGRLHAICHNKQLRDNGPEDRAVTYEEMVRHLLETYPPGAHRGDELMTYIAAEIEAAEARGAITPEVREKVYRHFGITSSEHG